MARSTSKRRAASRPRPQVASRGPVSDRQPPGAGPGGLTSMSMMRNAVRAPPAAPMAQAKPAAAKAAEKKEETAAREASKFEAVAEAGAAVSAVKESALALVPKESPAPEAPAPEAPADKSAETAAKDQSATDKQEAPGTAPEAASAKDGKAPVPPGEAPPQEAPPEPSPEKAVAPATRAVSARAAKSSEHQPAEAASDKAIKASDKTSVTQARMAQDASMKGAEKAKTGKVDTASFEAVLQKAIDEAIPEPKSEREARDVMKNGGKRAAAKVGAGLADQKSQAVGELPAQVDENAVPDPSQQKVDPEAPLVKEEVGAPPEPVSAGPVVAPASTLEAIDTSANRESVDQMQADNKITKDQLEKGNDPQFTNTLGARSEAEKHDVDGPKKLREAEAADRANARALAHGQIDKGLAGFHGERATQFNNVAVQQGETEGLTATRKQEITDAIQTIADQTRTDVTTILSDMDKKVETDFAAAIDKAMEEYDEAFKEEKGGILTAIGDALTGDLFGSDRLEKALRAGRKAFDRNITAAISEIASYVERKLTEARDRVTKGREEVEEYMTTKVSDAEKEFAESAATAITADFDTLEGEINAAKDALVSKMVGMFKEGIERRNKREKELREANKSFWQKVWDATVGVVQKVLEFKNMLLGILARAAAVVEAIVLDPIGFLKNLIAGIGAGLQRFVANIGENLKKALMGWLFGALEGAGLKLPDKFDLMGFLDIVLQVLGLTKENVRARAVRILGEETVAAIETAVDFIRVLFTEGPAALWQMLLQKLGNIKDVILAEIRSWVITKVIEAGIKWIIGLLNPAGAFVKACMMIYDIVIFFIERGRQIIEAVNAIINTLGAIVSGNVSAMAQAVEGALNRILPVVISFLASLLGLGGISDTIRNFIEAVQKPVNAAIDWIIHQGVAIAKKIGGLFGGKKKDEPVVEDPDDPEKAAAVETAIVDLHRREAAQVDNGGVDLEEAENIASGIRADHPVIQAIRVAPEGDNWRYIYRASPERDTIGSIQRANGEPPSGVRAIDDRNWVIEPTILVSFNVNRKFRTPDENGETLEDEYRDQLNEQAAGINGMTVYVWLQNRRIYERRKAIISAINKQIRKENKGKDKEDQERLLKVSGRAPESAEAQQSFRKVEIANEAAKIILRWQAEGEHSDKTFDEIEALAHAEATLTMKGKHALHGPDQVAGGHPDVIDRMGSGRVNMSIGAQWRHVSIEEKNRIDEMTSQGGAVEEDAETPKSRVDQIQSKVESFGLEDHEAQITKMNVTFEMNPN